MSVLDVRTSSSFSRLPLCQIRFFAASVGELACGEKSRIQSLNHSLNHTRSLFEASGTEVVALEKVCIMYHVLLLSELTVYFEYLDKCRATP